ncbi:MAG: NADPH:quinone reductase [Burkholderiales bacterium]|nr:NADPH:quinone reductase [Burkholderiales bacterium]
MLAAWYESTGEASQVLQFGEMPDPQPGPGEVRVRLRWSGVNPSDVKSRAGLRSSVLPFPRIVPHSDGMGVVDAVGEGVESLRPGERVWVWNGAWGRANGTAAQYIVLPQQQAVPLPRDVADEAGACLGIPALTALHAVLCGEGVAGRSVLVAGGAGAVGHYAIQFARRLGAARVIATVSSAAKGELALAAGAHEVINYRDEDVVARVRAATQGQGVQRFVEVDVAANSATNLQAMAAGGEWVVYGSGKGEFTLPFFPLIVNNAVLRFFIVYNLAPHDRQRAVSALTGMLESGGIVHNIGQRLALQEIAKAHDLVAKGEVTGNVVLEVP